MTQQLEQTSQAQAAPAPDADALGALIGSYDKGFPHAFGIWFAAALSFGVGLFVLWLSVQNHSATAHPGDVYALYAVGLIAVAVGAVLGLLIRRLVAAQPAYDVFEHGIRTRNRAGEQTALYSDIEDMFSFNSRAMAFRISPRTPWVFLGYSPAQLAVLSELHGKHMAQRASTLFQQVMDGKTVLFRYFQNTSWLTRNMLMNAPTSELTLNKQQLTIGDKRIAIDRIDGIHISAWTGKKTIMAKDGTVFQTMSMNAVLSFDVLHLVLSTLQIVQPPQPGP
ncbi:hypothetical protein PO883_20240 [Massilia sp. DJPM01]|uniref:hypothetical protein n=1 Tax=Massilia sp. DJPM01 TaxID=3024404 RepID=UPI00259E98C4|nr:hypothetical protein [Massilia sp. DJPM01]MDM5179527.1 hypothetical protein [Massilia sp. DJPM01]